MRELKRTSGIIASVASASRNRASLPWRISAKAAKLLSEGGYREAF